MFFNKKEKENMKSVWDFFEEITRIPRPSKKEEKMRAWLRSTAEAMGLESEEDEAGNVLIKKEASDGREREDTVALQAHMDMVCEKEDNVSHNFETDAIAHHEEGGWIVSEGTTLGADDGIGIAIILSLLADEELSHPRLECLFTVDEETGLYGATNIRKGWLTAKTLINLDSEEEGEFVIGCAGGRDTLIEIEAENERVKNRQVMEIRIEGGMGGHSGEDIDKGRANAIQEMARLLGTLTEEGADIRLAEVNGGNLRNAIPRSCVAKIGVTESDATRIKETVEQLGKDIIKRFAKEEKGLSVSVGLVASEQMRFLTEEQTRAVIQALARCPHGVLKMDEHVEGLVRTSTNLAAVHTHTTDHNTTLAIETSQRSSVEEEKTWASEETKKAFEGLNAKVETGKDYPGWEPDWDSLIIKRFERVWKELTGKEARIKVIHAGLECGVLKGSYKDMEMISVGPTMTGVHSPSERVEIASVERTREAVARALAMND